MEKLNGRLVDCRPKKNYSSNPCLKYSVREFCVSSTSASDKKLSSKNSRFFVFAEISFPPTPYFSFVSSNFIFFNAEASTFPSLCLGIPVIFSISAKDLAPRPSKPYRSAITSFSCSVKVLMYFPSLLPNTISAICSCSILFDTYSSGSIKSDYRSAGLSSELSDTDVIS